MDLTLQNGQGSDDDVGFEIPNRVFVGGLCQETSELELENFFSDHGTVLDVRIVCDRRTGKNKGFGFVTFEEQSIARNLITKGSLEYKGHRIRLRKAVRKALGGQYLSVPPSSSAEFQSTPTGQVPAYTVDSSPQILYSYGVPAYSPPVDQNLYYYSPCVMPTYVPTTFPSWPPTQYIVGYY